MSNSNIKSVYSVFHVNNFDDAVEWYTKWIGRKPDITPYEGVAEWEIKKNAWIQVSVAPEPNLAGKSSIVCEVNNIETQRGICHKVGIIATETKNLGVVKLSQINDPEGNIIFFVQVV